MATFSFFSILIISAFITTFADTHILFQGFNWGSAKQKGTLYNKLKHQMRDLVAANITHVWLPPSSQAASLEGYLPGKLYDLDTTNYGTKNELTSLIQALHQNNIKSVADIVINHRTAAKLDSNNKYTLFEGGTSDTRLDWSAKEICGDDYEFLGKGNNDTGMDFHGAPDIDHLSNRVRNELKEWMNWMKSEIGFSGWRLDFVRGYAAKFAGEYVRETKVEFAVGEFWDKDWKLIAKWVTDAGGGALRAFDFALKDVLHMAVNGSYDLLGGNPLPGLMGRMPGSSVTFVDNHDTLSQNLWPFPRNKVTLGYVYILTHPGIPTIFYDHLLEDSVMKKNIIELANIRARNGIGAMSKVKVLKADRGLYMASIDENVVMKIGPATDLGDLGFLSGFELAISGDEYAVWQKKK